MAAIHDRLGTYLRDRRSKLQPTALGITATRRRTPGLRREEVAQRANISATWYTWLEQGRGGPPSSNVLDRVAKALMLTDIEREHLFFLAFGRPPAAEYHPVAGISPRLQRTLDAMDSIPAIVRTATWDVVAWNRAAAVVLTDYGSLQPEQRNLLRLIFDGTQSRSSPFDWEEVAGYVVAVFRADAARAGASEIVQPLVDELRRVSPDFDRLWRDNNVRAHGDNIKRLRHPVLGTIALEMSAFAVEGRSDLGLLVYVPANDGDSDRIRALVKA